MSRSTPTCRTTTQAQSRCEHDRRKSTCSDVGTYGEPQAHRQQISHLRQCRHSRPPSIRAQKKTTNIKEYVPETGFDVLQAIPGRRATSHDWFPMFLPILTTIWDPGYIDSGEHWMPEARFGAHAAGGRSAILSFLDRVVSKSCLSSEWVCRRPQASN
jgi:hypothetical protein